MKISRLTIGLGLAAVVVGLLGLVEASASPFSMFFLADDLGNRVMGTAPEAGEWGDDGKDNNGHGNNEDGVDSSNQGNSKADEDTNCDDAGNCVDDEMGSGSGSGDGDGKGNGGNKGKKK